MLSLLKSLISNAVGFVFPSWAQYALVAALVLAGIGVYAGWSYHLQQVGAERERAIQLEQALQHQQDIINKSSKIDTEVVARQNPSQIQKNLLKDWGVK